MGSLVSEIRQVDAEHHIPLDQSSTGTQANHISETSHILDSAKIVDTLQVHFIDASAATVLAELKQQLGDQLDISRLSNTIDLPSLTLSLDGIAIEPGLRYIAQLWGLQVRATRTGWEIIP